MPNLNTVPEVLHAMLYLSVGFVWGAIWYHQHLKRKWQAYLRSKSGPQSKDQWRLGHSSR